MGNQKAGPWTNPIRERIRSSEPMVSEWAWRGARHTPRFKFKTRDIPKNRCFAQAGFWGQRYWRDIASRINGQKTITSQAM